MKISWIKLDQDKDSFKIPKKLGFDVFSIAEKENVDTKIQELIRQDYHTIIVSSDIAKKSVDIQKKYGKDDNVDIIISLGRE